MKMWTHIQSIPRVSHGLRRRWFTRLSLLILLAGLLAAFGVFTSPVAQVNVAHATGNPNGWTPTNGSMTVARGQYTATLLPSGKVLVTGGDNNSTTALASAELYDPSSGTWNTTGSMSVARAVQTATLLSNGKVLVTGGFDNNNNTALASAELYDPSSGTWSTTGSMNFARADQTATLLSNGKVLVTGGNDDNGIPLASAELYDPSSGTWSTTGSMSVSRTFQTATLLSNGKVLVTGGFNNSNNVQASAELYDPSSGTWSTTGSMNFTRYLHTATLLNDGTVLAVGGFDNDGNALASAEFYTTQAPDTTAPTLSLPSTITVNATDSNGATVTYTVTATDPDNAPTELTISCSPLSGSAFPIGTTTVHCTVRDPANNTSSGSFQVVVKGAASQLNDLITLINSFQLQAGIQMSLDVKAQGALNAVNAGDTVSAHNALHALSNEVSAQTGKNLTADQASQIQAAITQIQHVLGY